MSEASLGSDQHKLASTLRQRIRHSLLGRLMVCENASVLVESAIIFMPFAAMLALLGELAFVTLFQSMIDASVDRSSEMVRQIPREYAGVTNSRDLQQRLEASVCDVLRYVTTDCSTGSSLVIVYSPASTAAARFPITTPWATGVRYDPREYINYLGVAYSWPTFLPVSSLLTSSSGIAGGQLKSYVALTGPAGFQTN